MGACTGVRTISAPLGAEDVVEAAAELRVAVTQQEAHASTPLLQSQQEVAGLLGDPGVIWVGGHAGQMDTAGVQLDEEQHVQSAWPDGIDGEEVAG